MALIHLCHLKNLKHWGQLMPSCGAQLNLLLYCKYFFGSAVNWMCSENQSIFESIFVSYKS